MACIRSLGHGAQRCLHLDDSDPLVLVGNPLPVSLSKSSLANQPHVTLDLNERFSGETSSSDATSS